MAEHAGILDTVGHYVSCSCSGACVPVVRSQRGASAQLHEDSDVHKQSRLGVQGRAVLCPACAQEMKAFWLPSKTPESAALLDKPGMTTYCPASGKKLRLKDLTPVRFLRCPEDQPGFARDPISRDTLSNTDKLVLLRPTGEGRSLFGVARGNRQERL